MYDGIRRDLLNSVNAILLPHGMGNLSKDELVHILLYGHESLSFEMNAKILSTTLEYIPVSQRFESSSSNGRFKINRRGSPFSSVLCHSVQLKHTFSTRNLFDVVTNVLNKEVKYSECSSLF